MKKVKIIAAVFVIVGLCMSVYSKIPEQEDKTIDELYDESPTGKLAKEAVFTDDYWAIILHKGEIYTVPNRELYRDHFRRYFPDVNWIPPNDLSEYQDCRMMITIMLLEQRIKAIEGRSYITVEDANGWEGHFLPLGEGRFRMGENKIMVINKGEQEKIVGTEDIITTIIDDPDQIAMYDELSEVKE